MLADADASFAERLSVLLPGPTVRRADASYLEEPRGLYKARPGFVVRPGSTDEVAMVVRACAEASVGIVPYGGGTGLVSGQVSTSGPVPLILSLAFSFSLDGAIKRDRKKLKA